MKKSLDQIRCEKTFQRGIDEAEHRMRFAKWLKEKPITPKEIAAATGRSLMSVSRWNNGVIPPAVDLLKIANCISKKTNVDTGIVLVEIFQILEIK